MITVSDLVYEYPTKRALHGVGFDVEQGSVIALVGPNGAGKTTLLRCLAALEEPYSGSVSIDGIDASADPRDVHARLGFLPDFFGLYEGLTVEQSLIYAARMHAMPVEKVSAAVRRAAERVGLVDRLTQKASELSRGLKQRLAIGMTIVHSPRVLLLDEPAAGLDPDARRALSDLILSLRDEGMTIIVSSHILAELEDYCTRMIIVEGGRLAGGGVVEVAAQATTRQRIRLKLASHDAGFQAFIQSLTNVASEGTSDGYLMLEAPPGPQERASLLAQIISAGFRISDFSEAPRTLEEAYLEEVSSQKSLDRTNAGASA
jgi:ABC-2 type transport system ATP-binding protein